MPNQFTASLWGDEAFSAILSMKSIPQIIETIARDTSPPLYNITEHLWFQIFGSSEVAIRSLSFVYYLIAIFFVYKIGKFLFGRQTGLIASLVTFLNPFFFVYAFEGRMYSILAASLTASMYFFLTKNYKFYALATLAGLYSHHFALFLLPIQGLLALQFLFSADKRKIFFNFVKSWVAIGILYIPWLIPLYGQTKMLGTGFWLGKPTFVDLRNLFQKYLAEGQNHPLSQLALYIAFGLLLVRDWRKNLSKSLSLIIWFIGPILVVFIISQKFTSIFYDRYLLYAIPAIALVLASNLRQISKLLLFVLVTLFLIIDIFYFTHPTKRPFRELSEYVQETKRGDDMIINWNSSAHHLWESKYYKIPAPIYIPKGDLPYFAGTALMEKSDIVKSLPSGKSSKDPFRIGVITSGPIEEVSLPGYTSTTPHIFGDLKFVWLNKK